MSKLYRVFCDCPTKMAANPFTVLAEDEADAVKKFKLRNGIVDTVHPIKAEETDAAEGEQEEGGEGDQGEGDKPSEKDQIKAYLVANPDASNKQVVEALAALGTVVTSSQVTAARKDV